MPPQSQGKNFMMMGFFIVLALVGFYVLSSPDNRSPGEKIGDAVDQLGDRTPGEKLGDAVKDVGEDLKKTN